MQREANGNGTKKSSCALSTYLDMELQVLIHGVDVVEDVLDDPGDDTHSICVMEVTLKQNTLVFVQPFSQASALSVQFVYSTCTVLLHVQYVYNTCTSNFTI